MNKFAIYSPTRGQREDYPVILLSNAVTSENSNTQEWDGEIRSAKLRKPELFTLAANLVGHWKMNGDSTDSSGNDNDGTDIAMNYSAGKLNDAGDFDGADSSVDVGSKPSLDDIFAGGGSATFWMDATSTGEAGQGRLLDKGNWIILMDSTSSLEMVQITTGTSGVWTFPITPGQYNHVVVNYDSETLATPVVYVDDVAVTVTVDQIPTGSAVSDAASNLFIGNNSTSIRTFDGQIDDVRAYNRELTVGERTTLYNAGTGTEVGGKATPPDGNEFMRYARFVLSDQTERLVGFTKDTVYYWDTTLTVWVDISPAGGLTADTEYWDSTVYGEYLCATNNQDLPIQWDGDTAGVFTYIDTQLSATTSDYISKAKYIKAYRNYLFLGYVTYNTGSIIYPSSVAWSNVGEGVTAGGFRQDAGKDAGTAYISGNGDISGGFGEWQGYLCVFKRASQRKMWYVGGAIPFNQDELNPAVGCVAPGSVINDKDGNLFYYGTDKNFREVSYGNVSKALVQTTRDLNPELLGLMRATYIAEYDEIWWAVAFGNTSTANNKILVFNDAKWEERDIPVTAFGSYTRQTTFTWDTWPFATWDSIGWDSWDTADANTDFPVDLCSDADGNTYEVHGAYTDDGQQYESFFVISTDMTGKQSLNHYKRLLQMYLYFGSNGEGSTQTADISIKADTEASFQELGSVTLDGTSGTIRKRLAVDVRARNFELKIGALNKFNFIGVEFEYEPVGAR